MYCMIEWKLVDFVQTVTTDTTITAETDLLTHNWLDSLLLMDLIILIESEIGVRLHGDDIAPANFRTLKHLASLVRSRLPPDSKDEQVAA